MKSSRARFLSHPALWTGVLVSLFCCGALYWFFHNFEKKKFKEETGLSMAARINPFLAAERYLGASGCDVESYAGRDLLTKLPPAGDVILVRTLPRGISGTIADQIYHWVEAGGHLIFVPDFSSSAEGQVNTLLQMVGVDIIEDENDCDCSEDEDEDEDEEDTPEITYDHDVENVLVTSLKEYPIELSLRSTRRLQDIAGNASFKIGSSYERRLVAHGDEETVVTTKNRDGSWLLQYSVGAGKITVMAETALFTNSSLDAFDNAFLLSVLTEKQGKIWLLYANSSDNFMVIVWRKIPRTIICAALLLLVVLWSVQQRVGLPRELVTNEQRSVLQHIEAVGQFLWKADHAAEMLQENRAELLAGITRRAGLNGDSKHQREKLYSWIMQKTTMGQAEIELALYTDIQSEQELVAASQAQQKLVILLQGERKV
ncbi:DUF4350 domain-containing protein [Desulfogranum japonicum]|uniref:DUF4350 domain-containing protein n=1 Tax=Desulfogranum japonicum TaxID=231447 RepID=UPI00048D31C1|nr:DUF4350 domain-containing protein [Desulfogranum japonicum]